MARHSDDHGGGLQGFTELWQLPAVGLKLGRVPLDLVIAAAQVLNQQIIQAGEPKPVFQVSVPTRIEGFKGITVALLSLNEITAAAGQHPAAGLYGRQGHHQNHRLRIAQPFLVRFQLGGTVGDRRGMAIKNLECGGSRVGLLVG